MKKPVLTQNQAIGECKKLWADIRESGHSKDRYFNLHPKLREKWEKHCPLCEWVYQGPKETANVETTRHVVDSHGMALWCYDQIRTCPLVEQFGKSCYKLGFSEDYLPEAGWFEAIKNLKEA